MENNSSMRLRDPLNTNKKRHFESKKNGKLVPTMVLGATALCTSMAHAVTPTYQAVANYFTDSGMCVSGGEGPLLNVRSIGVQQKLPGNLEGNYSPLSLPGGPWDCSNISGGEGSAFETGVENLLNNGTFQDTVNGLRAIANEEVITMGTLNVEISGAQMHNLTAHVQGLHQGGLGMRHSAVTPKQLNAAGKATGGGGSTGKRGIGFFMNAKVDFGERDNTAVETGFDFDAIGLTAGMDFRLNNSFVMGLAAGYGTTTADFINSGGDMDMDGASFSIFGTFYETDKYYVDLIANYTSNKFDATRTFTDPNNIAQTAVSDTDGATINVGLAMGYEYHKGNTTIGPFARFNYTKVDIDGFSETGAGPWAMQVDDQELRSFEGAVGIQMSKIISKPWGVLVPQIRVELVHEFENESRIIGTRFLGAVNEGFNNLLLQPTDDPDQNYFNVSVSTSAQFSNGRSAYVQYTGLIGQKHVSEHAIELGVRWDF